jgi:hypothetical protein
MATTQYIRYPGNGAGTGVTSLNGLTGGLTLVAGTGISITPGGSSITIANTEAGGTVTSVALSLPSIFTVSGSPVTTSGTLTGTFNTQTANTVFEGPSSGPAATPTFRALVTADLPAGTGTVTAVTASSPLFSSGGATPNLTIQVANSTQNGYLSSTDWNTFNNKQPAGSYITALTGDVTASGPGSAVASLTATTNSTITTLTALSLPGSQVTGNIAGDAANVTGVVAIVNGGTGQTTASAAFAALSPLTTAGDIIYENNTPAPARLPVGTTGQVLTVSSGLPSWATPSTGVQPSTYDIENATFSPVAASDALTFNLQTLSGATPSAGSPCKFAFRGNSDTTTTYTVQSATTATTVTLNSTSTLGIYDSANHWIYVYAIYTSTGGVELAVSLQQFDEGPIYTTTAEGGGTATSNDLLYSTTARSNAAIKLLGRTSTAYTSGNGWVVSPAEVDCVPFYPALVAARAHGSTSAITSGATVVINPTVDFDPVQVYNASTGAFTAPIAGIYRIGTTCRLSAVAFSANEVLELYVYKNGAQYSIIDRMVIEASVNNLLSLEGTDILKMNPGDTATIRMLQQSGSTTDLDASTFVYFEFIRGTV